MHKRFGFTAVELAMVIVVIGVLVGIGIVAFRSSQAKSRDMEREADISALTNHLESLYAKTIRKADGTVIKQPGSYPPLPGVVGQGVDNADFQLMLEGLNKSVMNYPGGTGLTFPAQTTSTAPYCATYKSCYAQGMPTTVMLGTGKFMYVPRTGHGLVCSTVTHDQDPSRTGECRSFDIFYVLEGSATVVRKIESKRK